MKETETIKSRTLDIGLIWAKCMAIWSQVSVVISVLQFIGTMVVLYTVTIHPNFGIPFWLYIVILFIGISSVITFAIKKGVSGYYRFFSEQARIAQLDSKITAILEKLDEYSKAK